MAGDHSAARNVNRDILINELDLRQVSNTKFAQEKLRWIILLKN
jgi:hypothetical protein